MSQDRGPPDPERCGAVSPPQDASQQTSRKCALAAQHLDGCGILISINLEVVGGGKLVFSSAKQHVYQALAKRWHQRMIAKLSMSCVAGTARIKQIAHCGPRPSSSGHGGCPTSQSRVYLQDFTFDPLLTEALHNPRLLVREVAYPLDVNSLGSSLAEKDEALDHRPSRSSIEVDGQPTSVGIEHDELKIIVVRQVIDRAKIAWLLLLLLVFSPALGIVIDTCFHNAKVGIAASAGVFALASFVQVLVAWIEKAETRILHYGSV